MITASVNLHSATLVLAAFAGVGLLVGVLYQTGILGMILRVVFGLANWFVRRGFLLWDRWLSAAPWEVLAGALVSIHLLRWPIDLLELGAYVPIVTSFAEYLPQQPTGGLVTVAGELRSGARANLLMGVGSNPGRSRARVGSGSSACVSGCVLSEARSRSTRNRRAAPSSTSVSL